MTSTELLATVSRMPREEVQCDTSDGYGDGDEEEEEDDVAYAEEGLSTTIGNGHDEYGPQQSVTTRPTRSDCSNWRVTGPTPSEGAVKRSVAKLASMRSIKGTQSLEVKRAGLPR